MNENSSDPPLALIVGGAGALGSALATELSERGYALVIADVDVPGCQNVVDGLHQQMALAEPMALDVTCPTSWHELKSALYEKWNHVDLLVFAAGVLAVGDFDRVSWQQHERVLDANLRGALLGCHTLVPWLTTGTNSTHIVFVASCAGFLTMPWSGSYNASKAGLLAFAETISAEYGPQVGVTVACPAFFPSALFDKAQIADPALDRLCRRLAEKGKLTPSRLARDILSAVDRRQPYVVVPRRTYWFWWLKRLFPGWYTRRLGKRAKQLRERSNAIIRRSPKSDHAHDR